MTRCRRPPWTGEAPANSLLPLVPLRERRDLGALTAKSLPSSPARVIAEARARLRILRQETTVEGYTLRKLYDLTLVRDQHPVFKLGWSLMHVIDESSPLFGETAETLKARDTTLLLTLEGVDESTSQTMQARHLWNCDQIFWHYRFVDIMRDENGVSHIGYSHFDDIVPLDSPPVAVTENAPAP